MPERDADRYGTPLLVADESHLRERARTFARLFPHPLYAVKAFMSHEMIRLVADEGLALLVATDGELEACLRAGVPASRIVLHGNDKSDDELRLAVREAVRRAMALPHAELVGIHAHIGSQVLEVEPYLAEIDVLLDLLSRLREEAGFEADVLDVGGGFGVAYTDEAPTSLDEIAPAVLARVREGAARRGLRIPHTVVEPGRSVVGQGMLTLYRVGTVKRAADGHTIVAVDGGMSDNVRPMLYGSPAPPVTP